MLVYASPPPENTRLLSTSSGLSYQSTAELETNGHGAFTFVGDRGGGDVGRGRGSVGRGRGVVGRGQGVVGRGRGVVGS